MIFSKKVNCNHFGEAVELLNSCGTKQKHLKTKSVKNTHENSVFFYIFVSERISEVICLVSVRNKAKNM